MRAESGAKVVLPSMLLKLVAGPGGSAILCNQIVEANRKRAHVKRPLGSKLMVAPLPRLSPLRRRWVESEQGGRGGKGWVEAHVHAWNNVAGMSHIYICVCVARRVRNVLFLSPQTQILSDVVYT